MKKITITDGEQNKEIAIGYDVWFVISIILVLPLPFYFIYKKQNIEILSTAFCIYILTPILLFFTDSIPYIGVYISLALYTIILIYTFVIVPKYLCIWKIKKYYNYGFNKCMCKTEHDKIYFENAYKNNSFVGNLFVQTRIEENEY